MHWQPPLVRTRWSINQVLSSLSPAAARHELHVIMDEVYMLTVFDEAVEYRSVLSLER